MEKFKKLYRLPNHRIRENTNLNSFVFCGKNWDYYFTRKNRDTELECMVNVELTTEYCRERYIDSDYDNQGKYLQQTSPDYIPSENNLRYDWNPNLQKSFMTMKKFLISEVKIDKSKFAYENQISEDTVDKIIHGFDIDFWDPIIIDSENYLRDGQHRLCACKILGIKFIDVTIQLYA